MKKVYNVSFKNSAGFEDETQLNAYTLEDLGCLIQSLKSEMDIQEVLSVDEVGVVRYYVSGIGYDKDDCVTDCEIEFGNYDTIEEARKKFNSILREAKRDMNTLFREDESEVYYWHIQIEECEETGSGIECIECANEFDVFKNHDVSEEIIWKQYVKYLSEWAFDRRDVVFYGLSPASFDEWYDNEFAENDDSINPNI